MVKTHDIYRQINYIQQILAQNKRPIGILLAAGCPLSVKVVENKDDQGIYTRPLIPDVEGLTKIIISKLSKGEGDQKSHCEILVNQLNDDGVESPNIEQVLSQVRSLRQVAGKGTVRGFVERDLWDLDNSICKIISEEVDKSLPSRETPYHNLAIWSRSIERQKPVHIFTTNYDLLMEQALEEESCPYFDGFIGSRKAFFDLGAVENERLLDARWTRLWKIHGSINWKLTSDNNVIRSNTDVNDEGYLIYPSHLKYDQSRKMPYLAMLDRLKEFVLTSSSALFICGYSFGDDHINDVLIQSLKNNPTGVTYAFLYGPLDKVKYSKAIGCAKSVTNLTLIAFDKAIIARTEGVLVFNSASQILDIPGDVVIEIKKTIQEAAESHGDTVSHELRLGDFAKFGAFLKELSIHQNSEDEQL